MTRREDVEEIELDLVLEAIRRRWDVDYSGYSRNFLRRRLGEFAKQRGCRSPLETIHGLIADRTEFLKLRSALSVGVTEMFRDPPFFRAFRDIVVPWMATFPQARIWCAGCSTGEEALSYAIILAESKLLHRTRIYATDVSAAALELARGGEYPIAKMRVNSRNYHEYGGERSLSEYYRVEGETVRFDPELLSCISWEEHDLLSDASFTETHFVSCRNVLIYFARPLRERIAGIIDQSLCSEGFLGIGGKERFEYPGISENYGEVPESGRLYRKSVPGEYSCG